MNHWFKRSVSALLSLLMVISMMPAMALFAGAAELNGLADSGIGLSYTEAGSKGTVSWSAAGSSISGTVSGQLNGINYRAEKSVLTITNKKNTDVKLAFDYEVSTADGIAEIDNAAVEGKGSYSKELKSGESVEITLSVSQRHKNSGANKAAIEISNLVMTSDADATTTFVPVEGGSYTVTDAEGKVYEIKAETKLQQHSSKVYTLTATAAEGYMFYGWYNVTTGSYFSYSASATYQADADATVKPVFVKADVAIFQAGSMKFVDLTEAGAYAKANGYATVVLVKSGVLAGNHTIPAEVTLLIPFDDEYTCYMDVPGMTGVVMSEDGTTAVASPWEKPYAYSTLTLSAGATITVDGAISVGGEHYASSSAQGDVSHCGSPSGPVGFIKMEAASEIVINNAGALYAWGYVIGDGTVTAKSGATVSENIQFMDYSGGSNTMSIALTNDKYQVFPMSQYYVQNVEAKLVLEYGATEYVHTALYVPSVPLAASAGVKFIGEGGMFRAAEGGSIIKEYLPEKDRLQINVVGGGSINSLGIEFGGQSADTSAYILPITNNITINILSGVTTINQNMSLLPGAEVIVAKGAELVLSKIDRTVESNGETKVYLGCNLYIYDADEWRASTMLDPDTKQYVSVVDGKFVYVNRKFAPLAYSPSRTYDRTDADLKDVVLDINGTFTINGYVYTTAGGANICSTEGTGVIKMVSGLSKEYEDSKKVNGYHNIWQAVQTDKAYFSPVVVTSLKLKNSDGTYTETEDAVPGRIYSWNAACGMWQKGQNNGHKGKIVGIVGASCEEGGYILWHCDLCGKDYKEYDGSSALGHTAGEAVIENQTDATCSNAGGYDTVVYCTVCNGEISRETTVIPATSHTHGTPVTENKTDATCTNAGGYDTVVYCTVCNSELSREHTVTPATGHTAGEAVIENKTDATCSVAGGYDTVVYCTVCNGEISREHTVTPATGHTNGTPVTENKTDATCTNAGGYDTVVYCTVCNGEISREHTVIPATGHTAGEPVIEEAEDGSYYDEIVYCTVCGEVVSKTRHYLNGIWGDVNGDGDVDTKDANLVCSYYNELLDLDDTQLALADVNGDGDVDTKDANLICSYYNELIDLFPVEK